MKRLLILIVMVFSVNLAHSQPTPVKPQGEGTEESPYEISTLAELFWIATRDTVDGLSYQQRWLKHYIQTADIDASDTRGWDEGRGWLPIGFHYSDFVSNVGLQETFEPFQGVYDGGGHIVENLYIDRPQPDEGRWILNIESNIGLFGVINDGAIVKNLSIIDVDIIGGIYTGGLVGNNLGIISNCYSTGTVIGTVSVVGGLAGANGGMIVNSFSISDVEGDISAGGFVGLHSGVIDNSFSVGGVEGVLNIGGFIGESATEGLINNTYWNTETSGQTTSDGGEGKTTEEMKQQSTFADWDFETIWAIDPDINNGYPHLQFFGDETTAIFSTPTFSISLGPNPIKNELQITITETDEYVGKDVKLSVFDSRGRLHNVETVDIKGAYNEVAVDVSSLPAGVCFLVLEVDGFDAKREVFFKIMP